MWDSSSPVRACSVTSGVSDSLVSPPGIKPMSTALAGGVFTTELPGKPLNHQKVMVAQSDPTICNPVDFYSPWNSPGQNSGVGSCSLLQGIFPTQGSNPGLVHCRILYQLSHKGSPYLSYQGNLKLMQCYMLIMSQSWNVKSSGP